MPGIRDVFTINAAPEGFDRQWSDENAFPEKVVVLGNSTWEVLKAKEALNIEWEAEGKLENTEDHEQALARLLNSGRTERLVEMVTPRQLFVTQRKLSKKLTAHRFWPIIPWSL